MNIIYTILLSFMITGCACTTLKVKPYPQAPDELMVQAEQLSTLPNDATLIDVSKTITANYTQYYVVRERLEGLQQWVQRIRKESLNVNDRTESSQETIR